MDVNAWDQESTNMLEAEVDKMDDLNYYLDLLGTNQANADRPPKVEPERSQTPSMKDEPPCAAQPHHMPRYWATRTEEATTPSWQFSVASADKEEDPEKPPVNYFREEIKRQNTLGAPYLSSVSQQSMPEHRQPSGWQNPFGHLGKTFEIYDVEKEAEDLALAKEMSLASNTHARSLDDTTFLQFGKPNGLLVLCLPDGTSSNIYVDVNMITNKCPLLAFSFEQRADGDMFASLEVESRAAAICLLRFLYTGDYLDDLNDIKRASLFVNAQLCKMASDLEVPELQVMAQTNTIVETDLACSDPNAPQDLCKAIRYIFEHLADQKPLVETLLHYCTNCFLQHKLNENEEFKKLAFDLAPFNRELCRTSFYRNFADDGAADIIRLEVCESTPHSNFDNRAALGDFLFELHGEDASAAHGDDTKKAGKRTLRDSGGFPVSSLRKAAAASIDNGPSEDSESDFWIPRSPKRKLGQDHSFSMPFRSRFAVSDTEESADDGFTLVHRPKAVAPSKSRSESSATGNLSSDSEWTDAEIEESAKPVKQSRTSAADIDDLESSFATIKPASSRDDSNAKDKPSRSVVDSSYDSDTDWDLL